MSSGRRSVAPSEMVTRAPGCPPPDTSWRRGCAASRPLRPDSSRRRRQEGKELLAAPAREHVRRSEVVLEGLSHHLQHAVARLMAVRVVDVLEVVDVDEQHSGARPSNSALSGHAGVELLGHASAVADLGQRRPSRSARLSSSTRRSASRSAAVVGERLHDSVDLAGRRAHGIGPHQHGDPVARRW